MTGWDVLPSMCAILVLDWRDIVGRGGGLKGMGRVILANTPLCFIAFLCMNWEDEFGVPWRAHFGRSEDSPLAELIL